MMGKLKNDESELYGALQDLENWLDHECALCGAVDGFDYNSGVEYGLRKAACEVQKRKKGYKAI